MVITHFLMDVNMHENTRTCQEARFDLVLKGLLIFVSFECSWSQGHWTKEPFIIIYIRCRNQLWMYRTTFIQLLNWKTFFLSHRISDEQTRVFHFQSAFNWNELFCFPSNNQARLNRISNDNCFLNLKKVIWWDSRKIFVNYNLIKVITIPI